MLKVEVTIENPEGLIAIYERPTSGSEETFYFTKDHLGSVDSATDSAGNVEVRLSYDAFGARRDESDWNGPLPSGDWTAIASSTRRGYTEHEALDNLGLVHMNGRVHDPAIGRFISADPFVTDPLSRQSFSRYSYVINNPLTLIDPSGFDWEFPNQNEDANTGDWFNPNFNPFSPVPQDVGNYGFAPNTAPAPNPVAEEPAPEGASVKCASKPCDDEYHETGSDVEVKYILAQSQGRPRPGGGGRPVRPGDSLNAAIYEALLGQVRQYDPNYRELRDPYTQPTSREIARLRDYLDHLKRQESEMRGALTTSSQHAVPRIPGGPQFENLREHAAKHSNMHPNAYYNSAVRHTQTGTQFAFRHEGQFKHAFVTRTGPDSFTFTSASTNGSQIFTHMTVRSQYLQNLGITVPAGF